MNSVGSVASLVSVTVSFSLSLYCKTASNVLSSSTFLDATAEIIICPLPTTSEPVVVLALNDIISGAVAAINVTSTVTGSE